MPFLFRIFALTAFALTLSSAAAQTAPPQASYPCSVSRESWYDEETKPSFTLELLSQNRYRITLNGQKQEGRFERGKLEAGQAQQVANLYERAGSIGLLDEKGKRAMAGLEVVSYGSRFLLLTLEGQPGTFVRCGAGDLSATARVKQALKVSSLEVELGLPGGKPPTPGEYRCTTQAFLEDGRPSRPVSTVDDFNLYPGGEALVKKDLSLNLNQPYTFDADTGLLTFSGVALGNLGRLRYFVDSKGRAVVQWLRVYGKDSLYKSGRVSEWGRCLRTGPNTTPAPSQVEKAREAQKVARTFRTAPGKGVPAAQIAFLGVTSEGNFVVDSYQIDFQVHLFLKDGTVYSELEVPPSDFDAATARKRDPQNWKQWKREGGKILVKTGGAWKPFDFMQVAPNPKTLSGELSDVHASGASYSPVSSVSQSFLTLGADGSFEDASSYSSSSGSLAAINGFSSVSGSFSGKDGSSSYSSTTAEGGAVSVSGSDQKKNAAADYTGRYKLEDYTLELKYESGKVERLLFFNWVENSYYLSGASWTWSAKK